MTALRRGGGRGVSLRPAASLDRGADKCWFIKTRVERRFKEKKMHSRKTDLFLLPQTSYAAKKRQNLS